MLRAAERQSIGVMFDDILAGFDGLDGGRDAIALAAGLRPALLTVLIAYGPQMVAETAALLDYWDDLRAEADDLVTTACAELDVDAEMRVVADASPAHALHDAAAAHSDLLVIGSSHRGHVGRILVGDVGASVLRDAPCPVAVAPAGMHRKTDWSPRRIGVAYDGSDEALTAFAAGQALAARLGATLTICTAWEEPLVAAAAYQPDLPRIAADTEERAQRVLDDAVATVAVPIDHRLVHGRAGAALSALTAELDLMLVGSRGWGSLGRLVMGSTSHHLVHHSACPVVVFPRPPVAPWTPDQEA